MAADRLELHHAEGFLPDGWQDQRSQAWCGREIVVGDIAHEPNAVAKMESMADAVSDMRRARPRRSPSAHRDLTAFSRTSAFVGREPPDEQHDRRGDVRSIAWTRVPVTPGTGSACARDRRESPCLR
jgi:hypothetical protein